MSPKPNTLETTQQPTVALVVRHAELLPEAVLTALQFCSAGQAVALYLLEPAANALQAEDDRSLEDLKTMAACCSCNHRPTAERLGLTYSDVAAIAKGMEAAEWVLTF